MVRLEDITSGLANATAATARGVGRAAVATGRYTWNHGGHYVYGKGADAGMYVWQNKGEIAKATARGTGRAIGILGKTALSPWYFTGTGPFRRIEDNVYQPTTWFTGGQGPVQGQGTVWNLSWLYKPIADESKPNKGVREVTSK